MKIRNILIEIFSIAIVLSTQIGASGADNTQNLAKKIEKNYPDIREIIKKHAPEWPVEKMDPVERSILVMGVCELIDPEKDVPVNVAINEAIEIAKTYGDNNSGKVYRLRMSGSPVS